MENSRFDYEKYITETILPTLDKYVFQFDTLAMHVRLDHEMEKFKRAIHHGGGRSPDKIIFDGEQLILSWEDNHRLLYRFQTKDEEEIIYHIVSEENPTEINQQEFYREIDSLDLHRKFKNQRKASEVKQQDLFNRWLEIESVSNLGAFVQNDLKDCSIDDLKKMIVEFNKACMAIQSKLGELKQETNDFLDSVLIEKENSMFATSYSAELLRHDYYGVINIED